MLSNSWERFSKIRDAVSQEMNGLVTMHIYAQQLSDADTAKKLQEGLISYCDEVPQIDWHKYWKSEETHKKFRALFDILAKAKLKTPKDFELFGEISSELRNASHARSSQMLLCQTKLSGLQWMLAIFLSCMLIIGSALFAVPGSGLSLLLMIVLSIAVVSFLVFIHELDTMHFSEHEVAYESYAHVIRIVSDGTIDPDLEQWYQVKSAIKPPEPPHPVRSS
jgi:hypothetical protein